jgi:hypothetical protein
MAQDEHEMLELLRFELKFVEDGGYGRSPRTPWRPPVIFEDSPSCPNLGDPARTHPCSECLLMKFVPDELEKENSPCRFIPLNENGQTIDSFYRCGTQLETEDALAGWLRKQISRIEEPREAARETEHSRSNSNVIDRLRQRQGLAFAGNLLSLANLHRENHSYVVAHALYGRALVAAENVAAGPGDNGRSLVDRIRKNQQAVSEVVHGAERGVWSACATISCSTI